MLEDVGKGRPKFRLEWVCIKALIYSYLSVSCYCGGKKKHKVESQSVFVKEKKKPQTQVLISALVYKLHSQAVGESTREPLTNTTTSQPCASPNWALLSFVCACVADSY